MKGRKKTTETTETTETKIRWEAFLAIAAALIIIGSLSPWKATPIPRGVHRVNALLSWHGPIAFAGGFITLFATLVKYRVYRIELLQRYRPYTDGVLGTIGSALALVGVIFFYKNLGVEWGPSFGLYITIIGAALGIFAALNIIRETTPRIPKGYSEEEVTP